jgi:hypothetical protein
MNKSQRYVFCTILFFTRCVICFGQIDSLDEMDSLSADNRMEQLLEHSTQDEDSPLQDLLQSNNENSDAAVGFRTRMTNTLEPSAGFQKNVYLGSSMKTYQRLKGRKGEHYSGGIVLEKDAGEKRVNDFLVGSITLSEFGPLKRCVLGDYMIEVGQGISLWRGFDAGKGSEVIAPAKKMGRGLRPYLSTDENSFLSGAATEFLFGSFSAQVFYSHRSRNASPDSSGVVGSFYDAGYFRTPSEEAKRNTLIERTVGIHTEYIVPSLGNIGTTAYNSLFSRQLNLHGGQKFSGNEYTLGAIHYDIHLSHLAMFGEWAKTNGVLGGISGVVLRPASFISCIASFRFYPQQFVNLHGFGFGERASNERGVYVGLRVQPMRRVTLSFYADQFQYPDQSSSLPFPSSGNDILIQLETVPLARCDVTVRYQRKTSPSRGDRINQFGFHQTVDGEQVNHQFRLNVEYQLNPNIQLRERIERVYVNESVPGSREKGLLVYHDIAVRPSDRLWSNLRFVYFNSDSYNSRAYEYERDLDGVLSLPALYGRGIRWYAMMKYHFLDKLNLSAKYSGLIRDDLRHIGSGLDELEDNRDDRVGFQMDVQF